MIFERLDSTAKRPDGFGHGSQRYGALAASATQSPPTTIDSSAGR